MSSIAERKPKERRSGRLRRNVGLVVLDGQNRVLAGLRAHANGDKAWQLPQGGIEGRERALVAAFRELKEETGVTKAEVELVAELPKWTTYYLPEEWTRGRKFVGQTQKWFMFRYLKDGLPDLSRAKDREFEQLDWVDAAWLVGHVIAFRKPIYSEVFEGFGLIKD